MVEKIQLENGIRFLLEEIPTVRSVAVGIWVNAGSRYEEKEKNGISHFIEHMLFKGTKKRTAREIAQAFDRLGGQVNAFTSKEYTCFYAKVLDTHLDQSMEILTDMFCESTFSPSEMEKEKQVILEEIGMVEDTPDDLIHDLVAEVAFGDHPLSYAILGQASTLESFSREDIEGYMGDRYSPEGVVVSIAGHFDRKVVKRWMERFARMSAGKERKVETLSLPGHADEKRVRVRPDLEQAHLAIAYPGLSFRSDEIYAMTIFNSILGGSMSSRLFQEIRETRGLAYNVYSYHSAFQETGLLVIYAGTRPEQLEQVEKVIQGVLEEMSEQGVTDEELAATKEQLKGSLMLSLESTSSRMSRNGKNELLLGEHPSLDQLLADYDAVTPQDVHHVAQRALRMKGTRVYILPE